MSSGRSLWPCRDRLGCERFLRSAGLSTVIITLGKNGTVLADASGTHHRRAPEVAAVDSTGAGDTFVGALSCALVSGSTMPAAVDFAQHAAALSVTRRGAQASMPNRSELKDFVDAISGSPRA